MKRQLLYILMFVLTGSFFTACEPDANIKEYTYPEASVSSIYPETGYIGTQVMISGTNFGDRKEAVKITVGGAEVTHIISCKNDRIIFEVPQDAQSGDVSLKVWTKEIAQAGTFTVIPTPEIEKIVSSNAAGDIFAAPGDKITIMGKAFGTDVSDISVTVNGEEATVTYVDDNQIIATLPKSFTSGIVKVRVRDITLDGTALIDPNISGDVTKLFLKNYAQPFERAEAGEGEWAMAKYWTGNASAYMAHTLNFTDDEPDGLFTLDGNGKFNGASIYQVTTLPPGTYTFEIDVKEINKTRGRFGAVFAVGKGDKEFGTLTDAKHTPWHFNPSADLYCQGDLIVTSDEGIVKNPEEPVTCSCTLTETTNVRIGFGTMLAAGQSIKIKAIRIIRK